MSWYTLETLFSAKTFEVTAKICLIFEWEIRPKPQNYKIFKKNKTALKLNVNINLMDLNHLIKRFYILFTSRIRVFISFLSFFFNTKKANGNEINAKLKSCNCSSWNSRDLFAKWKLLSLLEHDDTPWPNVHINFRRMNESGNRFWNYGIHQQFIFVDSLSVYVFYEGTNFTSFTKNIPICVC